MESPHYHRRYLNQLVPSGPYNGNSQKLLRDGIIEHLDKHGCMERYLDTTYRHNDVVVVSADTFMADGQSLDPVNTHSSLIDSYQNVASGVKWMWRTAWLCSEFTRFEGPGDTIETSDAKAWCSRDFLLLKIDSWALKSIYRDEEDIVARETTITVDYCLSAGIDTTRGGCAIRYSLCLLLVVTMANLIKLVCMCAVWFIHRRQRNGITAGHWQESPHITLGDALSSFLSHEDENTRDLLFVEKEHCSAGILKAVNRLPRDDIAARMKRLRARQRWFRGAGKLLWALAVIMQVLKRCPSVFG